MMMKVEHDLQGADPDDQCDQTHIIHGLPAGGHWPRGHLLTDHKGREQTDRYVDEENPRPAVTVSDPAAKDRPGDGRHDRHHGQQCQCHPPFRRGIDRNQQRLGHGIQRTGHHALNNPKAHQFRH
jgi:hypothetical protein